MSALGRSKKQTGSKPRRRRPVATQDSAEETRSAEALTVGWMVTVMATLMAECAAAGIRLYQWSSDGGGGLAKTLQLVSGMLFFVAATMGLFDLVLIPLVYRARKTRPPDGITIGAVVIGVIPWATILTRVFAR